MDKTHKEARPFELGFFVFEVTENYTYDVEFINKIQQGIPV